MDPKIQAALLKDPAVQEAVRKAGHDALANPEVQAQILKVCEEKFPELALAAKDKLLEWANDPEVQKQAYHYAGVAMDVAWKSVQKVAGLIEQGPAGVRIMAFLGGVASCGNAVFIMVLSPFALVSNVTHIYQIIFALTTMLFEAKPEWIERVSGLNKYQDMLIDKAKFLAEVFGRGLFYGFQGILWLYFSSILQLTNLGVGLYFLFIAFLHICMHFGIMPQEVAAKMQSVRTMVQQQILSPEKPAQAPAKDLEKGEGGLGFAGQEKRDSAKPPKIEAAPTPSPRPSATPATAPAKEESKANTPEAEPLLAEQRKSDHSSPAAHAPAAAPAAAAPGPVAKPPAKSCCTVQ